MKVLTYHRDSPITQYLIQKDPVLKDLFAKKEIIYVRVSDDYFVSLVDTIIAQQLSSKVAQVISKRVFTFFDEVITPQKIMDASEEALRPLGLSFQKIKYLKSLADCIIQGKVDLSDLESKSDQEIIDMLIQIKGIGVWTAQMFLMFSLGREDVFSVLDLGLRNAFRNIYQNQELSHQEIEQLAENWAPYRSVVSHFLWHAWDSE
jgi:DNA-3-methyladenine glycosylase II